MAYHNYFLIVLLALLGSSFVKCAEFVPVFMWGTNKMSEHVPALHKTSQDSFKDTLLEYLKRDPQIIVFAERTLSPEDFAQRNQNGESAFVNIQKLKDEGNYVSYRPYVQNPIGAIKQLNKPVTQTSISKILDSDNVPKDHIWMIDLDDAKDYETRSHMLKRHDSDTVSLYKAFQKKRENLLVLYTANHTAWVAPSEVAHVKSRNLLQSEDTGKPTPKSIIWRGGGFTFYLTEDGQYKSADGQFNLSSATTVSTSAVGDDNVIATLTQDTLKVDFNVTKKSGYWYVSSITAGSKSLVGIKDMYAPVGFSYHCGSFNLTDVNNTAYLYLPGFQVQAFMAGNVSKFGDAYDCVGFTSIPIWSGLFVTAILLLIITFGLTMMMEIKTMDRFDDPKGKTITVTASE